MRYLFYIATPVVLLLLALPRPAHAYVDPGSGAMIWQLAAAAVVGSMFYVRRVVGWVRKSVGVYSPETMGYLFATVFALVVSPVIVQLFRAYSLPRFNDIFLVGIFLTSYLFSWRPAVYLLVISVLVSAYLLPPDGTLQIQATTDIVRLVSFTAVSMLLIVLSTRQSQKKKAGKLAAFHTSPQTSTGAGF